MKVIERANIPDGTEIWLEDWSDKNTEQFPDLYGLQIGAYPIAKNTGKYGWIRERRKVPYFNLTEQIYGLFQR